MITTRTLMYSGDALEDWRPVVAETFDEGLEKGLDKAAPEPTHAIQEPPPWRNHPANRYHFVFGDLVLPARDDTDDVAVYLHEDGRVRLVALVGEDVRVVRLRR